MNHAVMIGLAFAFLTGCHGTSETPNYGTGGASSTSGTGGTGGNGGTGSDGPAPIPFAVDDYYAASGFMGDGEAAGGLTDAASCPTRAGEKRGLCHHITWNPGSKGWAGTYWQYPDGNWGTLAGREIVSGATQISFWAWGEKGGETVEFFSGINPPDGYKVTSGNIVLTTTPTQYIVKLQGAMYSTVVGAFGWSSGTSDGATPVTFYVDDIQWQEAAGGSGCTSETAMNYDPSATMDDGSCQYAVTFQIDMTGVTLAPGDIVTLQATFNQWCGDCNPLADPDKTGIWSVTLPLQTGAYEYKYTTNGWAGQVEDVPLACDITGGAQKNRGFTLAAEPLTLPVKWGACPP